MHTRRAQQSLHRSRATPHRPSRFFDRHARQDQPPDHQPFVTTQSLVPRLTNRHPRPPDRNTNTIPVQRPLEPAPLFEEHVPTTEEPAPRTPRRHAPRAPASPAHAPTTRPPRPGEPRIRPDNTPHPTSTSLTQFVPPPTSAPKSCLQPNARDRQRRRSPAATPRCHRPRRLSHRHAPPPPAPPIVPPPRPATTPRRHHPPLTDAVQPATTPTASAPTPASPPHPPPNTTRPRQAPTQSTRASHNPNGGLVAAATSLDRSIVCSSSPANRSPSAAPTPTPSEDESTR
jgi:hypothetical protein